MPQELKTVEAKLAIEVFVDCPKCEFLINLLEPSDTCERDHNDDNMIMRQACGDGFWMDDHKKFKVANVTCSQCKTKFNVKGLEW
jgi:hypothetical protein